MFCVCNLLSIEGRGCRFNRRFIENRQVARCFVECLSTKVVRVQLETSQVVSNKFHAVVVGKRCAVKIGARVHF